MGTNLTVPSYEAATNDIRDIKPLVDIPTAHDWLWTALLVIVVVAVCYLVWRLVAARLRLKALAPAPEPPHIRAKKRLMEALELIGQPEPFVVAVSGAVRSYLEERFGLRAPERTTEEFLRELSESPVLTSEQKETLEEFLKRSDLVKFARYEPPESELRELHTAALRLVDETAPVQEQRMDGAHAPVRGSQPAQPRAIGEVR
ncbi:MAG: hypothetical protein NZ739_00460 [Verrucomicrobiae bacterium]|nr:hypothetical protein [Verrucomicrobiae bacterium]